MAIDPKSVQIRKLSFATISDARAEAQRLAQLAREGKLKQLGNWTPGQTFGHLAWWIEAIDEGKGPTPPWFMKFLGPLIKKQMLKGPLPQGFKMPSSKTGTHGDEPCDLETGIQRLRAAYTRLETKPLPDRHPVFGKTTRDEWLLLHRKHAELHLGYLTVK
jgi:hypothetical protein